MKGLLLILLVLSSCNAKHQNGHKTVEFSVLTQEFTGGKVSEEMQLIQNNQDLESIYNIINTHREPSIPTPSVDFDSEMVICLFMGEQTSGGYSIEVEALKETPNELLVFYKKTTPQPHDMVTMAITQPYCIVKTRKVNKPLKFEVVD